MSNPSPPEVRCPKCGSNQIFADKDGFSAAKAAAGALIAGPAGLIAGGLGSGNVNITCLACGFKFKPGETAETLKAPMKKSTKVYGYVLIIAIVLLILGLLAGFLL